MKKLILITAVVIPFMAAEALAQMGGGGQGGQRGERPEFSTLDTDASGALSSEELQAMATEERPDIATNILSRMDADSDGELTEEEFTARPERGGGGGNRQQD